MTAPAGFHSSAKPGSCAKNINAARIAAGPVRDRHARADNTERIGGAQYDMNSQGLRHARLGLRPLAVERQQLLKLSSINSTINSYHPHAPRLHKHTSQRKGT